MKWKERKGKGRKKTRRLENVSRLKTKCFGWWSMWWRVSDKGKVASYLDSLSLLKAFRCSAPLSGSSRAKLELLFLFLAADERTESDPDSWDYVGIWVTHYCHPNMCHPPRLSTWQHFTFCESNAGKTGGFPRARPMIRSVVTTGIVESKANLSFKRTTCIGMCY